jgi:hypothetical protein
MVLTAIEYSDDEYPIGLNCYGNGTPATKPYNAQPMTEVVPLCSAMRKDRKPIAIINNRVSETLCRFR